MPKTYHRFWFAPGRDTNIIQRRSKEECDASPASIDATDLVPVRKKDRNEGLHYADS
jgi:hypothetical protein